VKSLSSELDEVYGVYDSLVAMNIRLEEKTKDLQRYILQQFQDSQQQEKNGIPTVVTETTGQLERNPEEPETAGQDLEGVNLEEPLGTEAGEEAKQSIAASFKTSSQPVLLLSADIAHELGELSQYSFPSSIHTLFEDTYHLLEASVELRMNKRDSFSLSDHRNSTRIIQEQTEANENLKESTGGTTEDDLPPKNSLFGKMLSLDPSALLDALRNPPSSASSVSSSNQSYATATQSSGSPRPSSSFPVLSLLTTPRLFLSHAHLVLDSCLSE
jgi:hypothetical protein